MSDPHLFTDADNTLWDTNAVFAEAQLAMLRELEIATGRRAPDAEDRALAFLRRIDQRIAASHPERLRYPPGLLAHGLALALEGEDPDRAAARAVASGVRPDPRFGPAATGFVERLQAIPALRPRVREGLAAIAEMGIPITVVTEERLERCRHLLEVHGLASLVDGVVSVRKTADAFRNLKRAAADRRTSMVGDQLDRDIRAAHEAGFVTFYFPSGFVPYWSTDADRVADHEISRYDEIVPLLGPVPTAC